MRNHGNAWVTLGHISPQRAAVPGAELAEYFVLNHLAGLLRPRNGLMPGRSDVDDVPAAVLGVASADRVAPRLQLVQQQDNGVGIQQHRLAQLLLGRAQMVT